MDRRSFAKGSLSALTVGSLVRSAAAQDAPTTGSRWDEISQLYGNAWDLLPQSEEGKIQFLNLSTGIESKYGLQIKGIIHNNTDSTVILADLMCEDGLLGLIECTQWIIAPGAYAMAHCVAQFPLKPGDEIPVIEPFFITPEEVFGPFKQFVESVPLRVEGVRFDLDTDGRHPCVATLTNTSDIDPKGQPLFGMVMFVNEDGIPTMTTALSSSDAVPIGETVEVESTIYFDYDPTEPFLIGFSFIP